MKDFKLEKNAITLYYNIVVIIQYCNRDVAQLGSASGLGPEGRRFESCHPDHVGTSFACSDFLCKKSVTCCTVPPPSQKVTLGLSVRL